MSERPIRPPRFPSLREQAAGALVPAGRHRIVAADAVPERLGVVAFLSGQERVGHWTLARHSRVVSVMGGVSLDLREAEIGAGESTIEIVCVMGGVEIIVPPEVRVIGDGAAFAGGFEVRGGDPGALAPDAPILRVRGSVYFGGVEVAVRAWGDDPEEDEE